MMKKTFRFGLIILIFCQALIGPLVPVTGMTGSAEASPAALSYDLQVSRSAANTGTRAAERIARAEAVGVFSYPVVEQPGNNPGYVSNLPATLTHFQLAQQYGTIGFLAHNTLAGAKFSRLQIGGQIKLVYDHQSPHSYWVTEVRKFQALSPLSPYSEFIDLDDGSRFTASGLFLEIYGSGSDLVFQTCLEKNGNPSWGRLFVVASEIPVKFIRLGMLPPDALQLTPSAN